ncbi:MAG: hypothetical protein OXI16_00625 [Chloroflexota bacterium]|nr:hypothetical protein [Chloroflexota bacterium]
MDALYHHIRFAEKGGDFDAHANSYEHGYSYVDANPHTNANGHEHGYSYADADSHSHSDAHEHGNIYANANSYSHSDANIYADSNSEFFESLDFRDIFTHE